MESPPVGREKLSAQERYRIRQGVDRTTYEINDEDLVVTVVKASAPADLEISVVVEIVEGNLARSDHASAVIHLLDEYARDPMGGGTALSRHVRENLLVELRRRDAANVILAFIDGEPSGLVICFEGFSTFACRPLLNIHDVIVSRQHRGKGLSTRMLQEAEAIARKLGCCKMTLEVLEGNAVAQAAYRSYGFAGYELDPRMGKAMFWEKKVTDSEPNPQLEPMG